MLSEAEFIDFERRRYEEKVGQFGAAVQYEEEELESWYLAANLLDGGFEGVSFEDVARMLDIVKLLVVEIQGDQKQGKKRMNEL